MSKKKTIDDYTVKEISQLENAAADGDVKAQKELDAIVGYKETKGALQQIMETAANMDLGLETSEAIRKLLESPVPSPIDSIYYTPTIEQQQNDAIINELKKLNENRDGRPDERNAPIPEADPVLPPSGATLEAWFDYMYALRAQKRKFTLDDLAEASPYSRPYIGREHPKYKKKRREQKGN